MRAAPPPEPGERRFTLLGDPVDHSVSPAIHEAAFRAIGVRATYGVRAVSAADLPAALRAAARAGGGNVTLPHKELAAEELDVAAPAVGATGACNCFWADARGRLCGDNTDVEGFAGAAEELLGEAGLVDARVLLLGAGGAARAVVVGVARRGAGRVEVLNRTPARARELARDLATRACEVVPLGSPDRVRGPYELAVNATSLSLDPDGPSPPGPEGWEVGAALDLVYGPDETAWVRRARRLGIPAADGLGMLVRQAALSHRRWLGEVDPPMEAMMAAARRALGRRAAGRGSP